MIRLVYFENDITDILPSNDNTVITVLEKLIADLSEIIKVKTHFEESIFLEIASIINFEKSFLNKSKLELEFYINTLCRASIPDSILNSYTISEKKKKIKHMLNGINSVMVPESLRRIGYLTNEIFKHILYNKDEQDMSNIYSIVLKIFYITECQGDEIKHLQELKKNFTKTKKITINNIRKIKKSTTTSYRDILSDDITSLRKIIREHNLSEFNTESFFIYKNDFKMQVEIEMLTLSILSSLEYSNLFLITTQLSNEEGPLLVGKYLRNYLAHGNAVADILMDSTQSLFIFTLKIIKHDIYRKGNFRIKRIKNLWNAKSIVENQESLFCALSNGSLANVKHWMKEGADIYGRDPDKKTALHFASKSFNITIIKFLIDRGLNPKTKDVNDINILHIATASGCKEAVSYIIEDLEISVDEKLKYNQTALHIAAEKGFFDVVEILLHHKATINVGQFHETPLYKAVINDKAKTADLLLQNVQDINSIRHASGKTLLHVAADLGHKSMVEYLLCKGTDVNSVSDTRVTPLHKSAYAGHLEIVSLLISNGAIVNAKDSADNIPLHFAAFNGQSSTAEILLTHGADFNAFNKEKLSPLHRAILNGHINVLKSFIEHGASIEDVERRGFPVFEYAIPHNNLELINILIENGMSINIRDPNGCTPLHQSIRNGSVNISLKLIEWGADINSVDKFNLTPLSLSIKLGYFEIVDKLLSEQANIHSVDYKGHTLLHMCVLNFKLWDSMGEEYFTETYNNLVSNPSRLNIFKKLVENGISIESENIFGRTPLHLACISGYDDIVQYLIPKLFDINAYDKLGYTPLHHAVRHNHLNVLNILLDSKNCCLDSKTFKNETALCLGVLNNYTESTQLLIKYGADVNDGDPLHEALMRGNQDMCIILLENKSTNIEKQFKDKSETLLWFAVNKGLKRVVSFVLDKKKLSTSDDLNEILYFALHGGYDDIVNILLNHGADVNFIFKLNFSPLHLAVFCGHFDIIKLLLERGADFNKLNSENQRPVDLAVFLGHLESAQIFFQKKIIDINEKIHGDSTLLNLAAECGHLDLVKFLINEGADLNVIGSFGSKPIHIAAYYGHLHIVKYFIQRDEKLLTDRGWANMSLLHYAAGEGQTEVVKYLIEKGIDVNDECDDGFRPIHFAVKFNHEEVIKVLLNYGAIYDCVILHEIENKDIKGIFLMTKELFHSVISNNISKVISLVDEGACINDKDSTDSTSNVSTEVPGNQGENRNELNLFEVPSHLWAAIMKMDVALDFSNYILPIGKMGVASGLMACASHLAIITLFNCAQE
ncbi:serine/threonine-protein phosphatase 6 regulatory ankyrin repeat subunit B-like [Parasteatoda tepidariorum]|uniref:serine/threonine-protein phosphatase 6 regulatory ankyrin repeat subunit B-like n=1 Tax=Parasteatoda tepidariorum TaxID=114398 RepID=UPI0039BD45F5